MKTKFKLDLPTSSALLGMMLARTEETWGGLENGLEESGLNLETPASELQAWYVGRQEESFAQRFLLKLMEDYKINRTTGHIEHALGVGFIQAQTLLKRADQVARTPAQSIDL